ncbi:MAG: gamma-glutamyltransferase [Alphaproteobacteria bacterium]
MNIRQSRPPQALTRTLARAAGLVLCLTVTACGSSANLGEQGFVAGFLGGIVASEPRAALVGRDVLAVGGTAADAAVAAYFAMAVTYPAGAGLGGGGACLVHDFDSGQTEALEFLATVPARIPPSRAALNVIPGNARGMFALQTRYGLLDWLSLLAPAERLARDGNPASRALVRAFKAASADGGDPAELANILDLQAGSDLREGDRLRHVELSAMISALRRRGPGDFYGGQLGQQYVDAVASIGGELTLADLRDARPHLLASLQVPMGANIMHFLPPPVSSGTAAAEIWAALDAGELYDDAPAAARDHLLAEASRRVYDARRQWMAADGSSKSLDPTQLLAAGRLQSLWRGYSHTGRDEVAPASAALPQSGGAMILVVDRDAQAVACSFTMNRPFGQRLVAPGTGIVLAAPPNPLEPAAISAMLLVNPNTRNVYFGAAAAGNAAASAIVKVALASLVEDLPMTLAQSRPRLHHGGTPDEVIAEAEEGLSSRGHRVRAVERLGLVAGFACPDGLPRSNRCEFKTDPRGYGLAATADN